jgi:hypothetical protein
MKTMDGVMLGIEGQIEGCGNVYMGFPEQLLIAREHKVLVEIIEILWSL